MYNNFYMIFDYRHINQNVYAIINNYIKLVIILAIFLKTIYKINK